MRHRHDDYQADVIAIPPVHTADHPAWTRADCRWHARRRQVIEAVFAILDRVFGIKRVNAHTQWGDSTSVWQPKLLLITVLYGSTVNLSVP